MSKSSMNKKYAYSYKRMTVILLTFIIRADVAIIIIKILKTHKY